MVEIIVAFVVSVLAGIVSYYICQDRKKRQ